MSTKLIPNYTQIDPKGLLQAPQAQAAPAASASQRKARSSQRCHPPESGYLCNVHIYNTYVCMSMCVCICVCVCICICICTCTCICVCICICVCVCVCDSYAYVTRMWMSMYTLLYMYTHMYMRMCMYIYIHILHGLYRILLISWSSGSEHGGRAFTANEHGCSIAKLFGGL